MEKEKYIVGIEDLASNLLIEYKSRRIKDYITYEEISKYADNIRKQLNEENIDLIVSMNRNKTDRFFELYSNFFKEIKEESKIVLEDDISEVDLIYEFRGYLPFKLLLTMIDENVVRNSIMYNDKDNNKVNIK